MFVTKKCVSEIDSVNSSNSFIIFTSRRIKPVIWMMQTQMKSHLILFEFMIAFYWEKECSSFSSILDIQAVFIPSKGNLFCSTTSFIL